MSKDQFSIFSIAYVVGSNAILLALIYEVFQDYAYRAAYWESMHFTPTTKYYPFFYVTSAVNGSTYIPGQLTLDWTQVLGAILVIIDAMFILRILRARSEAKKATVPLSNPDLRSVNGVPL